MLSGLFTFAFAIAFVCCDVIKEQQEWIEHEDYFDFTCLQEMSEKYVEGFFLQYPSLKPANRVDVITLKKSFVKFMDLNPAELKHKLVAGSKTVLPEHKVLIRFLKGFKQFAEDEFYDLSDEEQIYLRTVDEYVIHKLIFAPGLKYIKQKKADFQASSMGWKEFEADVMAKCRSISLRWDRDPSYVDREL